MSNKILILSATISQTARQCIATFSQTASQIIIKLPTKNEQI